MPSVKFEEWGRSDLIKPGHQMNEPSLLFEKIEDDIIDRQIEKLKQKAVSKPANTSKEMIEFKDFEKLELKTGTITAAEKMPKSKKLLKLNVDMGDRQKTILSGIAEHYSEEEVIDKQVLVLNNLPPRKMMGIESEGMILMAEDSEGKLCFVSPEQHMKNGSEVR